MGNKLHPLGAPRAGYVWGASAREVDMATPAARPVPLRITAAPQNVTIDLERTAMIVIDMQNDFCSEGGWVDYLGADFTPDRKPIKPLQKLLPALRAAKVPIVWVNWGNRPDLANMPPNQIHLYKPTGSRRRPRRSAAGQRRAGPAEGLLGRRRGRRTRAEARGHQGRQASHQRLLGHAARFDPAQPRHAHDLVLPASTPTSACCIR